MREIAIRLSLLSAVKCFVYWVLMQSMLIECFVYWVLCALDVELSALTLAVSLITWESSLSDTLFRRFNACFWHFRESSAIIMLSRCQSVKKRLLSSSLSMQSKRLLSRLLSNRIFSSFLRHSWHFRESSVLWCCFHCETSRNACFQVSIARVL